MPEEVRITTVTELALDWDGVVSDGPVVGSLLLSSPVSRADLATVLTGETWSEEQPDDPNTWCFDHEGTGFAAHYLPTPIPDDEAQQGMHPIYCGDNEAIRQYSSTLVLASTPALDSLEAEEDPFEARVTHMDATATVIDQLCRLPQAVGVFMVETATTYAAELFGEQVHPEGDLYPGPFYAPVRLRPLSEGRWEAWSCGLAALGIPEVQVVDSSWDPTELFEYLSSVVDHELAGNLIMANQTVGRTPEEKLPTSWQHWLLDPEVPALQITTG